MSVGLGMILASVWSIVFNYIYLKRKLNISITRQVFSGIVLAMVFLAISVYASDLGIVIKLLILLTESFFVVAMLETGERKKLYQLPVIAKIHRNASSAYAYLKWNT